MESFVVVMEGSLQREEHNPQMNITESVRTCLITKYADFYDRAPRSEFWWFYLSALVTIQVCYWFMEIWLMPLSLYWTVLSAPVSVGLGIPMIAATTRRLHDIGRSGWNQLWALVPFIGLVVLWRLIQPGAQGDNRYGPNPLD